MISKDEAVGLILDELSKAEKQHPWWPDDYIHASAILNEEAGELTQACLQYRYDDRPRSRMLEEAVQVGAMAVRFIMGCGKS